MESNRISTCVVRSAIDARYHIFRLVPPKIENGFLSESEYDSKPQMSYADGIEEVVKPALGRVGTKRLRNLSNFKWTVIIHLLNSKILKKTLNYGWKALEPNCRVQ